MHAAAGVLISSSTWSRRALQLNLLNYLGNNIESANKLDTLCNVFLETITNSQQMQNCTFVQCYQYTIQ